jgi:hypothetical protein
MTLPLTREERDALVARYRDGADAFRDAIAAVTEAELDRTGIEDEWTVREIAHHLADSELASAIRLRRLVAEDEPLIEGYDEEAYVRRLHPTERPIAASVDAAAAARASSLSILETLTEDEWARTGRHSDSGAYSVEEWLRTYANHPWDHADQARRVLAALRAG